jgi:hypothetical protein
MNIKTWIAGGAAAVAAAGAGVIVGFTGVAGSAESLSPIEDATAPCTSNYHAGVQSVDLTIQNNTGQVLTLDSGHTGRADIGHWGTQPQTTLQPGECEEITGYSDDPLGDFYLTATYRLPDGTYIPFSADSGDDSYNRLIFTSSGMSGTGTGELSGQQDFDWTISNPAGSGTEHIHYTLSAAPASS